MSQGSSLTDWVVVNGSVRLESVEQRTQSDAQTPAMALDVESRAEVMDLSLSSSSSDNGSEAPAVAVVGKGSRSCKVCSNPAGRHNYYGGQSCTSCRAFFRRSVWNGTYPKFRCMRQRTCNINSKSWGSCKFCRMQKCLAAGMRPA